LSAFEEQSHSLPFSRDLASGCCLGVGATQGGHAHCCMGMRGWGGLPDHLHLRKFGVLH